MSDAETTLKFAIRDALASTAHFTGVIPQTVDKAVNAVYESILRPDVRWTLEELIRESTETDSHKDRCDCGICRESRGETPAGG